MSCLRGEKKPLRKSFKNLKEFLRKGQIQLRFPLVCFLMFLVFGGGKIIPKKAQSFVLLPQKKVKTPFHFSLLFLFIIIIIFFFFFFVLAAL